MDFSLTRTQTQEKVKTPKELARKYAREIHDFDIDTATRTELVTLFMGILANVDIDGVKTHSPLSHVRNTWSDDTPSKRHWQVFYHAYQTLLALHHDLDAEEHECGMYPRSTQWFQLHAELRNVFALCVDSFQRFVTAIENETVV